MDMGRYDLSWSVGLHARHDPRLRPDDLRRLPRPASDLKLIAAHGGGTLPYLVGRFEKGDAVELASGAG
jgi:aminocarboxymuconate-semialdehyde decarboxylase